MAQNQHLNNPPPRSWSLLRSKELNSFSGGRYATPLSTHSVLPIPESPMSNIIPNEWASASQELISTLDSDFSGLPTSPLLPNSPFTPELSTPTSMRSREELDPVLPEEEEEEVDIYIPLMTSLCYDNQGCIMTFGRDRSFQLELNRSNSSSSLHKQTFPRDALSWYLSPLPSPRPATPGFSRPALSAFPRPAPPSVPARVMEDEPKAEASPPSSTSEELCSTDKAVVQVAQEAGRHCLARRRLPKIPTTQNEVVISSAPAPSAPTASKDASPKSGGRPLPSFVSTLKPATGTRRPLPRIPTSTSTIQTPALIPSIPRPSTEDRGSLNLTSFVDFLDDVINSQPFTLPADQIAPLFVY